MRRPPKQNTPKALVHAKLQNEFTEGTGRLQLFRASMSLPESKAWTACRTAKAFGTYIPTREFRAWLQFYCQDVFFTRLQQVLFLQ